MVPAEISGKDQVRPRLPSLRDRPPHPAPDAAAAPEVAPTDQALPLAKDYVGMGGPKTCPLYTPSAFENPKLAAVPVTRTILDEIFLEPTDNQLNAYNRVILKGQV